MRSGNLDVKNGVKFHVPPLHGRTLNQGLNVLTRTC